MDVDVSRWVLELLLCCPEVGDGVAKLAPSMLPLPNGDPVLLKSVALRSIRSEIDEASISEKLLDFIEVVEVIDRNEGVRITELMKEAYCSVAVECSVRYIHGGRPEKQGKFAEAARRIWTGRIRAMEQSAVKTELVMPRLLEWGRRIEAAVGDQSECLNLMAINSRADAFRAVRVYLNDALNQMRHSFLEAIACRLELGKHCSPSEESRRMHDDGMKSARQAGAPVNPREESTVPVPAKCTETNVTENIGSAREPIEVHKSFGSERPPHHKRKRGGPVIRDIEECRSEKLCAEYDIGSSPDVNKMQNVPGNSSSKLKAVVEDPLPDVLRVAGSFASVSAEHSAQNPARKVLDTQDAESNVKANPLVMEPNLPDKSSNHQEHIRRPTLMEPNSSACTDKGEGSIDDSREESTGDARRPRSLRRRRAISPMRTPQALELSRRKKKMWGNEEEDALRIGVQRFGKGNWKLILESYHGIFNERTEVDLKDKWRNMTLRWP